MKATVLMLLQAAAAVASVTVDWKDCNNRRIRKHYTLSCSNDVPGCQRSITVPPPGNDWCRLFIGTGCPGGQAGVDWIQVDNLGGTFDLRPYPKFGSIQCCEGCD